MGVTPPTDPDDPRPSRFEDLEVPVPAPTPRGRRTPTITTAAVIMLVSGGIALLTVVLLRPSGGYVPLLAAFGVLQIASAVLVFLLVPAGRTLGLVVAVVGVIVGVIALGTSAANGLVTLLLNGFVIYALASGGPSFRR